MYTILPATLADAAEILALQLRAYESEARLYADWSIPPMTQSLEAMREELGRMQVLKAVADGVIVGSVRAYQSEGVCRIGRLIVEPGCQRRGIGSALLRAAEAGFPGARSFELFTGSRSEDNIRLYRRHGYEVAMSRNFSPSITLVFMSKPGPGAR